MLLTWVSHSVMSPVRQSTVSLDLSQGNSRTSIRLSTHHKIMSLTSLRHTAVLVPKSSRLPPTTTKTFLWLCSLLLLVLVSGHSCFSRDYSDDNIFLHFVWLDWCLRIYVVHFLRQAAILEDDFFTFCLTRLIFTNVLSPYSMRSDARREVSWFSGTMKSETNW
jgi:hypothetical protein